MSEADIASALAVGAPACDAFGDAIQQVVHRWPAYPGPGRAMGNAVPPTPKAT
jgi:hypothetical protein